MVGGRGRGRGQSAAQMLLQKASTQLRGERVPIKPREEEELASYLNSLTQKTTQQARSVNYEEFGDISISSGADPMTPRVHRTPSPAVGAGSKFLKKKQPNPQIEEARGKKTGLAGAQDYGIKQGGVAGGSKDVRASGGSVGMRDSVGSVSAASSVAPGVKKGGFQTSKMSSALDKATALTNKITQRATGGAPIRRFRGTALDSDTDESVSPVLRGARPRGIDSRPGSASDASIGHDGNKFMKKRPSTAEDAKAEEEDRSISRSKAARNKRRSKSAGDRQRKGVSNVLRGSSNVYLTSEEESLAEFIQGLSGSDESRQGYRQPVKQAPKGRPYSSTSPSPSPDRRSAKRRSPSPASNLRSAFRRESPKPARHRLSSQDSDMADSIASEVADSIHGKIVIADSISLDEPLQLKLMDATSLGRIVFTPEPASQSEHRKSSKSKSKPSPFKKSHSPSPAKSQKQKKDKSKGKDKKSDPKKGNVFASLGVHSIEELLGSDRDVTDESEIQTEPIDSRKRRDHSTSQIITEIQSQATPQRQVSYSEDFEPSISERIGVDDKSAGKQVSVSSVQTQYSSEETDEDYSESFASETLSVAKDSDEDRSSHYRYTDDETQTLSEKPKKEMKGGKRVVVESRSVEIQTSAPTGLYYQWNYTQTGVSVAGQPLGLGSVDPTPIAATVINPDALEAMTAYSPATLAIHEMLKQQIELIQQFVRAHDRLYHSLTDSNVPDYHYTTLEGTKAYIRKHGKPRLTMKQALKMVSEEMDR